MRTWRGSRIGEGRPHEPLLDYMPALVTFSRANQPASPQGRPFPTLPRPAGECGNRSQLPFGQVFAPTMRRGQVQDLLLHVGGQSEQVHDLRQPGSADMPRPVEFDNEAYRRRNIVERLIGWLKESRRIFSRYEKTAKNFAGMLTLAFIRQYLRYELV